MASNSRGNNNNRPPGDNNAPPPPGVGGMTAAPGDTQAAFSAVFSTGSVGLIRYWPRTTANFRLDNVAGLCLASLIIEARGQSSRVPAHIQSIVELLYPDNQDAHVIDINGAQIVEARVWSCLLSDEVMGRFVSDGWRNAEIMPYYNARANDDSLRNEHVITPFPDGLSFNHLMNLLYQALSNAEERGKRAQRSFVLTTYLNGLLALCKRGTMTPHFRGKVAAALTDELGLNATVFEDDMMTRIYRIIENKLTAQRANTIFTRWENYTRQENFSLRARLIITRSALQGIASYRAIYDAMRLYPNFDWHRVAFYCPADMRNFRAAFTLVGEGQYAGYDREQMELCKRTKFQTLSWVCMEMMRQLDPSQFGGFANYTPMRAPVVNHRDALVALIAAYVGRYRDNVEEQAAQAGNNEDVDYIRQNMPQ